MRSVVLLFLLSLTVCSMAEEIFAVSSFSFLLSLQTILFMFGVDVLRTLASFGVVLVLFASKTVARKRLLVF
jgi:hypothetical protein